MTVKNNRAWFEETELIFIVDRRHTRFIFPYIKMGTTAGIPFGIQTATYKLHDLYTYIKKNNTINRRRFSEILVLNIYGRVIIVCNPTL